MRRKLSTAQTLSLQDWWTLLQVWFLLLVFDLGLRALPFPLVQKAAALGRKDKHVDSHGAFSQFNNLQWLVRIAARNHLYEMTCLRQSLALQWLLARRGIPAELRIGVRKQAGALEAHAWVECAGQAVEARGIQDYFTLLVVAASELAVSAASSTLTARRSIQNN